MDALEVGGADLSTVVEDEAQVDGDVEVDSENVGLDGGAEADGGIEVGEPGQQQKDPLLRGKTLYLGGKTPPLPVPFPLYWAYRILFVGE